MRHDSMRISSACGNGVLILGHHTCAPCIGGGGAGTRRVGGKAAEGSGAGAKAKRSYVTVAYGTTWSITSHATRDNRRRTIPDGRHAHSKGPCTAAAAGACVIFSAVPCRVACHSLTLPPPYSCRPQTSASKTLYLIKYCSHGISSIVSGTAPLLVVSFF